MRSVRLGVRLETRLKRASKKSGRPASAIVRDGAERACNEILDHETQSDDLARRLSGFIGAISCGGDASQSRHELIAVLSKKRQRKRR